MSLARFARRAAGQEKENAERQHPGVLRPIRDIHQREQEKAAAAAVAVAAERAHQTLESRHLAALRETAPINKTPERGAAGRRVRQFERPLAFAPRHSGNGFSFSLRAR